MPTTRVEAVTVDEPTLLVPSLRCEDLTPGERPLAVSPEGDLWLAGAEGLRTLGTNGEMHPIAADLEGEVESLVAWSDQVATAVVDGQAWRIEPEGARYLFLPEGVRQPSLFCGDLERDGQAALVNADGIYERAAGQWWALGPDEGERFEDVEWLATVDGACAAPGGGLWFGEDRQYVRVDASSMAIFHIAEATGPAVVGEVFGVAIPARDQLLFARERGPDDGEWTPVTFAKGVIESVGASANVLWVLVGNHLYRYDGEWGEADVILPSGADRLLAHAAGGVWAVGDDQACHIGEAPVRLRGIRPMEHFLTQTTDVVVESAGEVVLAVDGEPTTGVAGDEPGLWVFSQLPLGGPGWHELTVTSDAGSRRLSYRVMAGDVSWEIDVQPIYEDHCASSSCHGSDSEDTVDLSTYDAWFDRAIDIQNAVVTGRMPRDAGDEWNGDLVATIVDWIDGGMQP